MIYSLLMLYGYENIEILIGKTKYKKNNAGRNTCEKI